MASRIGIFSRNGSFTGKKLSKLISEDYDENKLVIPGNFPESPYDALWKLANNNILVAQYLDLDFRGLRSQGITIQDSDGASPNRPSLDNFSLYQMPQGLRGVDFEQDIRYLMNESIAYKNGPTGKSLINSINGSPNDGSGFDNDMISQVQKYYKAITGENISHKELRSYENQDKKAYLINSSS